MPIANKYSIKEILDACKDYIEKTKRRVTFEYSLVKDVNDGIEDAKSLGKLLNNMLCHVNLIPVNEVRENSFKTSSDKVINNFENTLKDLGIEVTVRRQMGSDINAACGQLRRSYLEKSNDEINEIISIIEYTKGNPKKYLVLNSRLNVLSDVRIKNEKFSRILDLLDNNNYMIDMDNITLLEKA